MTDYRFKAIDSEGRVQTGIQEAVDTTDLEIRLARLGLDLIRCKPRRRHEFGCRVSRTELINFSFHLEQLTRAGVPLVDALRDLRDSEQDNGFQAIIGQIAAGIEGGKTFSEMLESFPHVFGEVYASMIRVGEQSGKISAVLRDLAEDIKWQDELAARVKRMAIYPAITAVVLAAVILFVMVYLVPQLVTFVANVGDSLPWYTKALLATSDFLVDYGYALVLVAVGAALGVRYASRGSTRFGHYWDQAQLRLWLLGPVLLHFKLARFAHYAAIMYAAGIPVLDILQLGRRLVDNRALDRALNAVHARIRDGATIADGFAGDSLFPPLVVRLVRVGEGSGALDTAFTQIAYFYGREARESVQRFEQFIGPLLTLCVGLVLLWVIAAVIFPLLDTAVTIGGAF